MGILILVSGGSASGKTSFAEMLAQRIGNYSGLIISMDRYYKDVSHLNGTVLSAYNFDHPDALQSERLVSDVQMLIDGKEVILPTYDFISHRSFETSEPVVAQDIVIVEGIFALAYPGLLALADLKVFVDSADDIRLLRRIRRDRKTRALDLDFILDSYENIVKPMHDSFIEPQKKEADVIVPGLRRFSTSLDMMEGFILKKIIDSLQPSSSEVPGYG